MGRYNFFYLKIWFCSAESRPNGAVVDSSSKVLSKETAQLLNELFEDKEPTHNSASGKLHKDIVAVRLLDVVNTKQSVAFTISVPKMSFSVWSFCCNLLDTSVFNKPETEVFIFLSIF